MSGADITAARRILPDSRIDDLGEAIIALTREIWVLSDRQAVLEKVLAEEGIAIDRVDHYQPDAAMAQKLAAKRQSLIDNVLQSLRVD